MPTLEDLSEFIKKKVPENWSKESIIETLEKCIFHFCTRNGNITGILVYGKVSDKGHHIYFLCSEDSESRKNVVFQGLKNGCWPISSKRRGKYVFYKRPNKLIEKLLTYE